MRSFNPPRPSPLPGSTSTARGHLCPLTANRVGEHRALLTQYALRLDTWQTHWGSQPSRTTQYARLTTSNASGLRGKELLVATLGSRKFAGLSQPALCFGTTIYIKFRPPRKESRPKKSEQHAQYGQLISPLAFKRGSKPESLAGLAKT